MLTVDDAPRLACWERMLDTRTQLGAVVQELRRSPVGIAALVNVRLLLTIKYVPNADVGGLLAAIDNWLQAEAAYGEELLTHAQTLPAPQAAHTES